MASGGGAGERQGAEQIRLFAHGGGHTYFRTLTGWPRAAYWTAALSAARRTLVASISIASESSKKIVYKNLFCYTFAHVLLPFFEYAWPASQAMGYVEAPRRWFHGGPCLYGCNLPARHPQGSLPLSHSLSRASHTHSRRRVTRVIRIPRIRIPLKRRRCFRPRPPAHTWHSHEQWPPGFRSGKGVDTAPVTPSLLPHHRS